MSSHSHRLFTDLFCRNHAPHYQSRVMRRNHLPLLLSFMGWLSQSKLAFHNLKILPVLFLNSVGTVASYQDKPTLKAIFLSPGYFYTPCWNTRTGLTLSSVNSAYVLSSALQYEVNKLNQSCHWQWSSSCKILTKKSGTITTFIILLTNFNWFVRKLFSFVISLNQYDLCTIFCLVESW